MKDPLWHRARTGPDSTALIDAASGDRWTVTDLDEAVERTAGRLAALGVRAGDHLGVVLDPRPATVETCHAAMRLGATLVPLDPGLTAGELARILERTAVTTLVCGASTADVATVATETSDDAGPADAPPVVSVDADVGAGVRWLGAVTPEPRDPHDWRLSSTVLLPLTSGTTGEPKAVRLTMRNVLSSAVASAFRLGLDRNEIWHVAIPLHHVGGLTPVMRMPLYGMTVVLRRSFDADDVATDLARYDVTATSLVPTMLDRLLDATTGTLGPSLRAVLLGGAPAAESVIDRCADRGVPVFPTYGMTETASQIATATPEEARANPGTVGRPLFWTELTVRDETGEECPPGAVGELVVSGPTVTPGYLDAPDSDPFGPHGLRTGDVGHRDESGRVWVVGRTDGLIVTGGENVAPAEVVERLRAHPDVADAAVVGLPDEEWGERVGALVVPRDDTTLTAADVEDHCRDGLAAYKIPRTIQFTDSIPRTDSGTVRRDAVRAHLS
jgi:O-succinylbenzoic acid--CoA ligase